MASNKASNNEAPREIYSGFSDDVIRNFLFQRQFYQPDSSQQRLSQQQHEIQATTTTAGREQGVEFSGSSVSLLTFVFNLARSRFN